MTDEAAAQLTALIDALPSEIAEIVRGCRARLRSQFPDAVLVVRAREGGLVIDFGPDPRPSHVVLSLEADADAVHLHLRQGVERSLTFTSVDDLSREDVVTMIRRHLGEVVVLMEASEEGDVIIADTP